MVTSNIGYFVGTDYRPGKNIDGPLADKLCAYDYQDHYEQAVTQT